MLRVLILVFFLMPKALLAGGAYQLEVGGAGMTLEAIVEEAATELRVLRDGAPDGRRVLIEQADGLVRVFFMNPLARTFGEVLVPATGRTRLMPNGRMDMGGGKLRLGVAPMGGGAAGDIWFEVGPGGTGGVGEALQAIEVLDFVPAAMVGHIFADSPGDVGTSGGIFADGVVIREAGEGSIDRGAFADTGGLEGVVITLEGTNATTGKPVTQNTGAAATSAADAAAGSLAGSN